MGVVPNFFLSPMAVVIFAGVGGAKSAAKTWPTTCVDVENVSVASATSTILPTEGRVFLSVKNMDKTEPLAAAARDLVAMGFIIVATKGTAAWLAKQGVPSEAVAKVYEGRPNIVDRLKNDDIALVLNTTEGTQAVNITHTISTTDTTYNTLTIPNLPVTINDNDVEIRGF